MKDWILELCPELAEWQAELIAEQSKQAVLTEREACAKMVEEFPYDCLGCLDDCAVAIRARSNQ